MPLRLTCVVGARPNFPKVAPIIAAAAQYSDIKTSLIHTGQHYDHRMSDTFFDDLQMPSPDVHLGVGSGTHAEQTARVMLAFDDALNVVASDIVLVVGDINSTLACALVAVKRGIGVAHVEAGLRSRDRSMPEEINRVLTDQISDYLFTTERSAADNLMAEGIPAERIHFVGNVMIDTLRRHQNAARKSDVISRMGITPGQYALCTLHRPSNVDGPESAEITVRAVEVLASKIRTVLPMHPRTRSKLESFGLLDRVTRADVSVIEPQGYIEFLALMDSARVVVTDSGGIQEETTVLGVPCLTFRENTERPITVSCGTNTLVGADPARLEIELGRVLAFREPNPKIPELWDGQTADRIMRILRSGSQRT